MIREVNNGCLLMQPDCIVGAKREFAYYRNARSKTSKVKINEYIYSRIRKLYFETLGKFLVDYEGGVLVEGYFYLFNYMISDNKKPISDTFRKNYKVFVGNPKSAYRYSPSIYIRGSNGNHYNFPTRSVEFHIRKGISDVINSGQRYKSYLMYVKDGNLLAGGKPLKRDLFI